ncbi:NPL4 family-domain-containing protein [Abortiporus biennis]|nr:NPL4 family-domain-containing protein [Abortiporus biennis]
MLIRIRSKDGNFRFELSPNASISDLTAKILETTINADPSTLSISNQPRGNEVAVSTLEGQSLAALGLKHGDLVFVSYREQTPQEQPALVNSTSTINPSSDHSRRPWETVQEDLVDQYWRKQDGKISRNRDTRFCKHGVNAMCDYCMPLEPYDSAYHTEHNIKHLSYHSYLRKLMPKGSAATTSSSQLPPLSPLSYKVQVPCPSGGHPDWPKGICTACQPSAITLQSQPFRMVDHLEIASRDVIDRFLGSWRETGKQRFGWLIGRYEAYSEVPMGVKAIVEAIHEPPQEGDPDGLSLNLPWEDEPRIRELGHSASSPLTIVGYIFTDLVATPEDRSKTLYKRHPQSFYLSSLETIFAAKVQLANPTPSRSSPTGFFSSRMVTAVLTGTEDGGIDVSAYQVSEQACAMVEADMIEASVEPGIVRVKEEDRTQDSARYVPDVFFRYKNEYGLEVKQSAKPCFPVEYLLVNMSYGFPQHPTPLFRSTNFPIENRPISMQSEQGVVNELARLRAPDVLESAYDADSNRRNEIVRYLSDWHLLAFLGRTQLVSPGDMKIFMSTLTSPNLEDPAILDKVLKTDSWETLMTFARESAPPTTRPSSGTPAGGDHAMDEDIPPEFLEQNIPGIRICPHCTFENTGTGSDCEICGLPLT